MGCEEVAKASVEKKHLQVGASGSVAPGVSQVNLYDEAQLQPVTLGPGWIYVHVSGDPAVGNTGVVEVVAMILDASQAIPSVLTASTKDELEEQLWWQTSITYGAGGAGSGMLLIKTQRGLRTGERLVIEAVTESFAAGAIQRSVTIRGQVMRIQA